MSGSRSPEQQAAVIKQAKADGHEVIFGGPRTLQLDLDSKADMIKARKLIGLWSHQLGVGGVGIERVSVTRSKSDNWHFYVHLEDAMPRQKRIFWQTCFRSDPNREACNRLWAEAGHKQDWFLIEVNKEHWVEETEELQRCPVCYKDRSLHRDSNIPILESSPGYLYDDHAYYCSWDCYKVGIPIPYADLGLAEIEEGPFH